VWDFQTEVLLYSLKDQTGEIPSLMFSPDGSMLACVGGGYGSSDVVICDVKTGDVRFRLQGHSDLVLSVAFAPDGTHVAGTALWAYMTGAPDNSNAFI
jgi:WD40 repeat protein